MKTRTALMICAIGCSFVSGVKAQGVVGERIEFCEEREVLVWGRTDDLRLFRGNSDEVAIARGEPVVWFCGRERLEVLCPLADRVDRVAVDWEKDGRLVFRCLQ